MRDSFIWRRFAICSAYAPLAHFLNAAAWKNNLRGANVEETAFGGSETQSAEHSKSPWNRNGSKGFPSFR